MLAEVLTASLAGVTDGPRRATDAGREWGRRIAADNVAARPDQAPRERLVDLLDELGFAPDREPAGPAADLIGLRNCPFLELSRTNGHVVCAVHLGVMQGVLAGWRAPIGVDRLDPFVEPGLCTAHLTGAAS
jgi:predicted ArsR family transcriptional regulator